MRRAALPARRRARDAAPRVRRARAADTRSARSSASTLSSIRSTGGPDGGGWPFGRTVYRSEVMALLASRRRGARHRLRAARAVRRRRAALRQRGAVRARAGAAGRHRLQSQPDIAADLKRSDAHECEPDEALERLNYFNGQRLAAADSAPSRATTWACAACSTARCIRPASWSASRSSDPKTRRIRPGKHSVIVREGWRSTISAARSSSEDVSVQVMGAPSTTPGVVFGNLLVVSYRETAPSRRTTVRGRAPYKPCSGDLPGARRRASSRMRCSSSSTRGPRTTAARSCSAQIELSKTARSCACCPACASTRCRSKPTTSHPLCLEGEKDIDKANPKFLHFHISDGLPDSVRLYLRGREFTSLYYTEMGEHNHSVTIPDPTISIAHEHKFKGVPKAKHGGAHRHSFWYADPAEGFASIDRHEPDQGKWILKDETQVMGHPIAESGAHSHDLDPLEFDPLADPNITIPIAGTIGDKGANLPVRTNTQHLTLINNLLVRLDSNNITKQICDQLEARDGVGKWLLVAAPNDFRIKGAALNASGGTGEIDLLKLGGVELGLGDHTLEFRIMDTNVGGNLQYNLYVK